MMEKCYDEGTLQAFLDNELMPELSQQVARHLADCDPCAVLLAEVEEETAFVFEALGQELNALVPTQRLWTKINESIEAEHHGRSVWQRLFAFASSLSLSGPQLAAFASLIFVVTVVVGLIGLKPDGSAPQIAANTQKQNPPAAVGRPPVSETIARSATTQTEEEAAEEAVTVAPKRLPAPSQYKIETASYADNRRGADRVASPSPRREPATPVVTRLDYIPGEDTYLSTIARLERTVNATKDEVLKPSARFSYEKNMAVVNDAIGKMKAEVKKNPKNTAARQVLFASYQNKIELLSSVTERGELMASLR